MTMTPLVRMEFQDVPMTPLISIIVLLLIIIP